MTQIQTGTNESFSDILVPYQWYQSDTSFYLQSIQPTIERLPVGIYRLEDSMSGLKLNLQSISFELPKKLYGTTTEFIDRVFKTWNNTSRNLGILLWGTKGTSKTVTCKIICNKLKLPVILVSQPYGNRLAAFLDSIAQDVVVFIDEFEKIYGFGNSYDDDDDDNDNSRTSSSITSLLSLLDGTSTNTHRRVWLFTSNSSYIDRNFLDRPSRIRYSKEFNSLDPAVVLEIVEDLLVVDNLDDYEKVLKDLLTTISKLEFVTIDSVMELINEVNIHQRLASDLIHDFNLQEKLEKYSVVRQLVDEKDYRLVIDPDKGGFDEHYLGQFLPVQLSPFPLTLEFENANFYMKRKYECDIVSVISPTEAIMRVELPSKLEQVTSKDGNTVVKNVNEDKYIYYRYTFEPVYPSIFEGF